MNLKSYKARLPLVTNGLILYNMIFVQYSSRSTRAPLARKAAATPKTGQARRYAVSEAEVAADLATQLHWP